MKEIELQTNLSDEEIQKNFENVDVFQGIMAGLEESLAFRKGNAHAATLVRKASLPDVNVASERKALNLTQKAFADVLGVSVRTVEAWESGRTTPSPTAKKLLYLIKCDNSLVQKLQSV